MTDPYDVETYAGADIRDMPGRELEQYEAGIGGTAPCEKTRLRKRASSGSSVHDSPNGFYAGEGGPADFISAARAEASNIFGYGARHNAKPAAGFPSRRQRRAAVKRMLAQLSAIRDSEQKYLDNVPENFQCCESFECGEFAVETLGEVIDLLAGIY